MRAWRLVLDAIFKATVRQTGWGPSGWCWLPSLKQQYDKFSTSKLWIKGWGSGGWCWLPSLKQQYDKFSTSKVWIKGWGPGGWCWLPSIKQQYDKFSASNVWIQDEGLAAALVAIVKAAVRQILNLQSLNSGWGPGGLPWLPSLKQESDKFSSSKAWNQVEGLAAGIGCHR
jgi:hypothetical protein